MSVTVGGTAWTTDASFWAHGTPVAYWPLFGMPVENERQSGFLIPWARGGPPSMVVANKAYSSWSHRASILLAHFKIPFEETVIPLTCPRRIADT